MNRLRSYVHLDIGCTQRPLPPAGSRLLVPVCWYLS